jgi:hypothetical protein
MDRKQLNAKVGAVVHMPAAPWDFSALKNCRKKQETEKRIC